MTSGNDVLPNERHNKARTTSRPVLPTFKHLRERSHLLNPRTHRRGGSRGSVSIHHLQNPRRPSYVGITFRISTLFPPSPSLFSFPPLLRTTTAPLFVYIHPNRTIDVFSLSLGKSTIQLTCTNSIDSLLPPPSSIIS